MYGNQESVYINLMNYFNGHGDITQVLLFGSRAKNTAGLHSDIDLCITFKGRMRESVKRDIDELVGVYSCDILFCDELSNEIKKQIDRDGIVIYEKNVGVVQGLGSK